MFVYCIHFRDEHESETDLEFGYKFVSGFEFSGISRIRIWYLWYGVCRMQGSCVQIIVNGSIMHYLTLSVLNLLFFYKFVVRALEGRDGYGADPSPDPDSY